MPQRVSVRESGGRQLDGVSQTLCRRFIESREERKQAADSRDRTRLNTGGAKRGVPAMALRTPRAEMPGCVLLTARTASIMPIPADMASRE